MRSALAVDIAAPPQLVFALARDVTRWADLLPQYERSEAVRGDGDGSGVRVVAFVARRPTRLLPVALRVTWRARTWTEPETLRLQFVHQGGATAGMDVTWRIEPGLAGRGARVTIEHDFRAPRAWAWFVDRGFTRPIATRTLRAFRAIAEAVATSEAAIPANPST